MQNPDPTLVYAYSWTQLSGSAGGPASVTLANNNTKVASFTVPQIVGTYGFEFKVTKSQPDGTQAITTAQTSIIVQATPTGAFIVTAGDAQNAVVGNPVLLSGSVDSQGTALSVVYSYAWTQVGTTPEVATLANANSRTASFIPGAAGTYTFALTVSATTSAGTTTVSGRTQVVSTSSTQSSFVLTANAGTVQQATQNSTVTLTGSAVTQGSTTGVTYTYSWSQTSAGPAVVTIANANSPSASFYASVAGVYGMRLSIVATLPDGSTRSAQADTQVVVNGSGTAGSFTVSAGDAKVSAVNAAATLKGTVTPQGQFIATYTYAWTQVGVTPAVVSISNGTTLSASIIPSVAGTYTFNLTVSALQGGVTTTQSSQTQIVVTAATSNPQTNFALSANAGVAQSAAPNAVTTLTGSQTSQGTTTGVTYAYAWAQVGVTPAVVVLSNANTTTASFLPTVAGTYTFQLTVTATLPDLSTSTATANTQVIVGGVGNTFSVSAGDAKAVTVNTAAVMAGSVSTQGTFSGATFSYAWTQVGVLPAVVTPSNAASLTASFAPTVTGTYTFLLTVTCTQGGVTTTRTAQTQVLVTP